MSKEEGWRLVAVRGATTVGQDLPELIRESTGDLLSEMMGRNGIEPDDIVSIVFTATPDLVSDFPAVAARNMGLSQTPLLCAQEIPVAGSVERCVRILMHVYSPKAKREIRHAYLHGARQLRTDLPE